MHYLVVLLGVVLFVARIPTLEGNNVSFEDTSSYLQRVLDEYEQNLHTRTQFIWFSPFPGEGFGSRVTGIVAAFYLALAMNRSLVVQWPVKETSVESGRASIIKPYCTSINYSVLFGKKRFLNPYQVRGHRTTPIPKHKLWLFPGGQWRAPTFRTAEIVGCRNFVDYYRDYNHLDVTTNDWFIPLIRHNPMAAKIEFIRRTAHDETVFRQLYHFLLPFNENIMRKVQTFWDQNNMNATQWCIHHRMLQDDVKRTALAQFDLDCPHYRSCVKRFVSLRKDRAFLATDDVELLGRVRALLQDRVVVQSGNRTRSTMDGNILAYVDLSMLMNCPSIMFSTSSGFSSLAAAINTSPQKVSTQDCSLAHFPEPCSRIWYVMYKLRCHRRARWRLNTYGRPHDDGAIPCASKIG